MKIENQKYFRWGVTATIIAAGLIFWFVHKKGDETELIVQAERGEFEIVISVTGELEAKNFENIVGPDFQAGMFRVTDIKILDIVAEGTIVETGDYVAELDRTDANNAIRDLEEHMEPIITLFEMLPLDTAVTLNALRDNIFNLGLALEEAKMTLVESKYEPPTTIRRAEINLENTERLLEQAKVNYIMKEEQARIRIKEVQIHLERHYREKAKMEKTISEFTIRAPKSGMVVYHRDRYGSKRKANYYITLTDNVVATLPDLSIMLSRTFINEIDISKVTVGQKVRIHLDAFPDKKYTGVVTSISNVGEQLPNSDTKVFEVLIEINESDPVMRPSMTTSNAIVINTLNNITYVSINAIFSQDSIPFVYTSNQTKQVVVLGETNDNKIIVKQGLSPGDKVYVTIPEHSDTWKMVGNELIENQK